LGSDEGMLSEVMGLHPPREVCTTLVEMNTEQIITVTLCMYQGQKKCLIFYFVAGGVRIIKSKTVDVIITASDDDEVTVRYYRCGQVIGTHYR